MTAITGGVSLITDLINLGLNYNAQQDQQYATRLNDAEQTAERQTARADTLEEKKYNRGQTATANAFAEMKDDQSAIKGFAGDLQNYLNSNQSAAKSLVTMWQRR